MHELTPTVEVVKAVKLTITSPHRMASSAGWGASGACADSSGCRVAISMERDICKEYNARKSETAD